MVGNTAEHTTHAQTVASRALQRGHASLAHVRGSDAQGTSGRACSAADGRSERRAAEGGHLTEGVGRVAAQQLC